MTTQTPDAVREAIRQSITEQLDEPWRDRVILRPEQWQVVLAALDSRAGDDLTPRERIARVVAWEHFGIAWHHMEKQSHADVLAMVDRMLDSRAGDAVPTINDDQVYRLRKVAEAECGCRIPAPFDEVADHVAKVAFDEAVKRCRPATPAPAVDAAHADRDALAGYRAAVSFISADSWDGCGDCMEILKAARAADWQNAQAADLDETARQLARIRQHRPDYAAPAVDAVPAGEVA